MDNFMLFNMYSEINFLLGQLLEIENIKLRNLERITLSLIQNGMPLVRIRQSRRRISSSIRALANKIELNNNNLVIIDNVIDPLFPRNSLYRNQFQLLEMIALIINCKELIILYKNDQIAEINSSLTRMPLYSGTNIYFRYELINRSSLLRMEIEILVEENVLYQGQFEEIFCN
jgi:hypothetical protein